MIYDTKSWRKFDSVDVFKSTFQEVVLIEDLDEGDSTLDCLKGAHKYHYKMCQCFVNNFKYPNKDWQKLSDDMVSFYLQKVMLNVFV